MKDLNLIKKIALRLCYIAAFTLLAAVLTSLWIWISDCGISWTKPWERGGLAALFFTEFVIISTIEVCWTVSEEKKDE